jgi:hypothetical protein
MQVHMETRFLPCRTRLMNAPNHDVEHEDIVLGTNKQGCTRNSKQEWTRNYIGSRVLKIILYEASLRRSYNRRHVEYPIYRVSQLETVLQHTNHFESSIDCCPSMPSVALHCLGRKEGVSLGFHDLKALCSHPHQDSVVLGSRTSRNGR